MMTFHVCDNLDDAESKASRLRRIGYSTHIGVRKRKQKQEFTVYASQREIHISEARKKKKLNPSAEDMKKLAEESL